MLELKYQFFLDDISGTAKKLMKSSGLFLYKGQLELHRTVSTGRAAYLITTDPLRHTLFSINHRAPRLLFNIAKSHPF